MMKIVIACFVELVECVELLVLLLLMKLIELVNQNKSLNCIRAQ